MSKGQPCPTSKLTSEGLGGGGYVGVRTREARRVLVYRRIEYLAPAIAKPRLFCSFFFFIISPFGHGFYLALRDQCWAVLGERRGPLQRSPPQNTA